MCMRVFLLMGLVLTAWLLQTDEARAAQSLPPNAMVVDDDANSTSPDFVRAGPADYWRTSAITGTAYYSGSLLWTLNNASVVENYATWHLPLSATLPMRYEVFAFIPAYNATTHTAKYQVAHAGITEARSLDQNAYVAEWVSLGTYSFTTHSDSYVLLTDATGELTATKQVGFDALAFVPTAQTVEPGPSPITNPISYPHSLFAPLVMNNADLLTMSTSRYVSTINPQAHYAMGCESGRNGEGGTIILDFGQPQQVGFGYGTLIFDYTTLASTSAIAEAAKSFLRGFADCAPASAMLNLAIGTSNFKGATNFAHGAAWAQMVNGLQTSLTGTVAARFAFFGANDIEPSWNTATDTRNWVQGYASAALRPYFNYGSCDGCPSAQFPSWTPNNGWSLDDIWFVSGSTSIVRPFPEIYATNGIHARQWQWVSLYAQQQKGQRMNFAGALTQWQACQETAPTECKDDGLDNLPKQGWQQMQDALASDPRTAQPLPPPSDISWRNVTTTLASNSRLALPKSSMLVNVDGPGRIVEDVQAPLPAQIFVANNVWVSEQANGETLYVFAGSARDPFAGGHDQPQGAVAMLVREANGAFSRKRTRIFRAHGSMNVLSALHVVSEKNGLLELISQSDERILFNITSLTWSP